MSMANERLIMGEVPYLKLVTRMLVLRATYNKGQEGARIS